MFKLQGGKTIIHILLLLFVGLFTNAQTKVTGEQEYIYYFPKKIREGLAKEINKWKNKNTEIFLVIDDINEDQSISFLLIPFDKEQINEVCFGFLKVKNSGRVTYIDGKKYYVVYRLDMPYGTYYKPFMSLTEKERDAREKQMLRNGQEEKSVNELYPKLRMQIYDNAKSVKFDAEGNIIEKI